MAAKIHYLGDGNRGPRGGKLMCFHCPGCGYSHPFEIEAPNNAGWQWNGSLDKPTFTPSLVVMGQRRCHLFMKDGMIEFLSDSHHKLAGQTVECPDWDSSE
jgi:hypothetical protein